MHDITIMDMALANTIAAGEVVERPASVVKELIENSIDAGAKQIIVEVNQMGLESIIVTDDGFGMSKLNLSKAVLRHATSKIFKISDLNQINTLGFRGEALPSIASVSKLEIMSRVRGSDGYQISVVNSKQSEIGHASLNPGTKVIVRELFYNTPARFKYIKSEYAEKNAITDVVFKQALSHPNISFQLIMDGKLIKKTLGNGSIPELIDTIYGKNMSDGLKSLSHEMGKIKIKGYLLDPKFVRSKRNDISIFINHRFVKNYALTQSVIEGYHTYIMTQKYPIALIYMDIDPSLVDVNVHPQKMEVKLANEKMISFSLTPIIKNTLESGRIPIRETIHEVKKEVFKPEIRSLFELNESTDVDGLNDFNINQDLPFKVDENEVFDVKIPHLEFIGTLSGTYLLFQNDEGLFLMDQHAAAERIRYEYYVDKIGDQEIRVYHTLIPLEQHITDQDVHLINEHKDKLNQFGFNFEGRNLVSHPDFLRPNEIDLAIHSILEQLENNSDINLYKLRNQLAKDISCKGAIKANHQLSKVEIDAILKDLKTCKNPYTCPHGRPVLIKLSNQDIEKMFKRIV